MKKYFSSYWIRSAFFTILQRFSLTFFGFVNFVILIRELPKAEMGVWTLFLTLTAIFEMTKTNLLKNAHIKYVSGSLEGTEKAVIASSSLVINATISLLFILLIIAFSGALGHWLGTGVELAHMLQWFIPGLVLMIFFSHLEAIQQSHLDFKGVFAGYFVRQVLFFGFILFHKIFHIPFSLTGLVLYQSITIFFGTLTMYYFSRMYLLYRFNPTMYWSRKIVGYGGYIFGSGMIANIFSSLDQLMTARFMTPVHVASYSTAARINGLIDIPSYAAAEVIFPKVSSAATQETPNRVKYLYEKMVAVLVSFTIPTALFIILFPGIIITTIAGARYLDAAPILQLYMITGILRPAQNQAANILNSIGRAKQTFYINTASLVFNCFINYLCLLRFGFYGPVIGTLITCLLFSIVWYGVMKKEIGMEVGSIIRHSLDVYRTCYRFIKNFLSKKEQPAPTALAADQLRIAYIANNDPLDKRSWSGITYYLGQTLQRNVGEVYFIGPQRLPYLVNKALLGFIKLNRVLFGREYFFQYSRVYSWFAGRAIRRQLKGKQIDCIVAPTASMLLAYLKTDIPIVYVSDSTFDLYSTHYTKEFQKVSPLTLREGNLLEKRALDKSSLIIYTSNWAADSAREKYGIPAKKMALQPLGANMDFTPDRGIIFEKEKNPVLTLLFLGVDWDRKGGVIALDTLKSLIADGMNARLIICGCTPPEGVSHPSMEVIPFLNKNKPEDHERFVQLLTQSHFLLLPTRADCSSLVSCEANAYGMPSIATRTGGVAELVLDGINGYCLPYHEGGATYARLIAEIFNDKKRYHELIRSSRQRFEDSLNWDTWAGRFRDLYKKHIAKPKNMSPAPLPKANRPAINADELRMAHVILAHKNPAQLARMLDALEHPKFDFFIHVDKKTDIRPFAFLAQRRGVYFIQKRVNVQWGCYSLVQAQLNGIAEVLATKRYDYVNILSAQDFPLRSAESIYHFFQQNAGTEFISTTIYGEVEEWPDEDIHRVRDYNFHNWRLPGKYRLQNIVNRILPARKYPLSHAIVGRSQWFTITTGCAQYMMDFLKAHPEVVRYFKYVWGADEFIFSTVVYNSVYQDSIKDNLMYTDWSEKKPNPKLLTTKDFKALIRSDKLFARKFDMEVDADIFTMLEEWVKGKDLVH